MKHMSRKWMAVLVLAALAATTVAAAATKPARNASRSNDRSGLASIVYWLADSARQGRGVGTAGLDSSAAYLTRELRRLGLRPGGDSGSYAQTFEVTTGAFAIEPSWLEAGGRRYRLGDIFQPMGFSTNGTLTAPVVFVGYGITAPEYGYDDYAGIDVHDKLVLMFTNEPGELDSTSKFDGTVNTPYAQVRTKAITAREHGALGMLVANGPIYHAGESPPRPRTDGEGYMTGGLLAAYVSDDAAAVLLKKTGMQPVDIQRAIDAHGQPHSMALPDSATVTVTLQRTRATIENVVGWIPGRDTTRSLVVGAHYDHLGYGGENSLMPNSHLPHLGADDNASGTAALVGVERAITHRMASGWRPQHNLVFCHFTGEEIGLVGSGYFVDDPTVPLSTVEAMVNMDMVGRLRDDKLMVMGVGTAKEFPDLVTAVNRNAGAHFALKTSSDGYGPSDHSSFYKKNVPVLMLFTGGHEDYHKPSDTPDKLNYPGLDRVTSYVTALVESLDARPKVTYLRAKADSLSVGRVGGGAGYGAYLGTIPDYMQTEGGVLLSGVRENGPGAEAGLRGGDTIIKFDDVHIDNIYDYTYALRSRKPGDKVKILVKRAGHEVLLTAKLGRHP